MKPRRRVQCAVTDPPGDERRHVEPSRKRATRGTGLGLVVLVAGVGLGAFAADQLASDGEAVEVTPQAASPAGYAAADGPLSCTIYDAPSVVYPPYPRSSLVTGAAYVILCEDTTGTEVVKELFLYQTPDE